MRFEKWNALGNDYVIVEQNDLPWELTPRRVRALCALHSGIGSDGILLLSEPEQRGFVARLRIFNPDGSEAELSGNGAREAVMYLRLRGWTDQDRFCIQTGAGEIRAGGRVWRFQHVSVGNPQCAILVPSVEELEALDLPAIGPEIEHADVF